MAVRHGGDLVRMTLNTVVADGTPAGGEPLEVDRALQQLAELEPRLGQVVEMRYFGGFTEAEIGEALGVTERTVRRDWEKARLLLRAMLEPT
jgi:DNA-directed RNA polymerase specialized sigma24 family protein